MSQLLKKIIQNSIKEKKYVIGSKEVLSSIKNSKLIIISKLIKNNITNKILSEAKNEKIPILFIENQNLKIEKISNIQFRASIVSVTSFNDQDVKSLLQTAKTITLNQQYVI